MTQPDSLTERIAAYDVRQGDQIYFPTQRSRWEVVAVNANGIAEVKCLEGRAAGQANNTMSVGYIRAVVDTGRAELERPKG